MQRLENIKGIQKTEGGREKEREGARRVQIISAPQWSAGGFIHMIYYTVPALGFSVCSRSSSSHIAFIMCATSKRLLPLTLSFLSRLDIFAPLLLTTIITPMAPLHISSPPSSPQADPNNPTMNSKRQTNKGNCVDVCSCQAGPLCASGQCFAEVRPHCSI